MRLLLQKNFPPRTLDSHSVQEPFEPAGILPECARTMLGRISEAGEIRRHNSETLGEPSPHWCPMHWCPAPSTVDKEYSYAASSLPHDDWTFFNLNAR